jgi:lauroyl/myristoyl acyltransferase
MLEETLISQDKVENYIDSSYYHPFYLPYYEPFKQLFINEGVQGYKKFFDYLKLKDTKRPGYKEHEAFKKYNIRQGLASTNLELCKDEEQSLTNEIFSYYQQLQTNFPLFAFMLKDNSFFKEYFRFYQFDLVEKSLEEGKGLVLSTHHWGAMEYSMIGLILKKLPVTFIISEYVIEWFQDIVDCYVDEELAKNIRFIGVKSGEGSSNNHIAYKALKELKENRAIFILSDHDVSQKSVHRTNFMGNTIRLPIISSSVAIKAGAPILHLYSQMDEENKVHVHLFGKMETSKRNREDSVGMAKHSMKIMEDVLKDDTRNWTYVDWYYRYMRMK